MKQIIIHILDPYIFEITKDLISVTVNDDADIVQAIAAADQIFAQMTKGSFPLENLSNLLQYVWDLKEWDFFVDVGVEVRDGEKNWIALRDDPTLILPPGTSVKLNPDAGCWWNEYGDRPSKTEFLEELTKHFGADHPIVAQYRDMI